jgi:hypothetical protein
MGTSKKSSMRLASMILTLGLVCSVSLVVNCEEEEGITTTSSSVVDTTTIVDFFDQSSPPPSPKGQCRMFGHCGVSPDDTGHVLNCAVNDPPQKLDEASLHTLELFCPELITKYGDELCCNSDQVADLVTNLALPQTIIGRCPTCFYNFRQAFCELACSPNQYQFLNVSKVVLNEESKS